jgi:hypothetical protein
MEADVKEKTWVKIVPAIIAGGATVLAAMLPLYCSSQRRLETVTQTADNQADSLQKQLAAMRKQLEKCEGDRARSVAGVSTASPVTDTVGLADEIVDHDFKFKLKRCSATSARVRCEFAVTNLMGDRELSLSEARIFADGNEYPSRGFTLGADSGNFARTVLPGNIPVNGSVSFASVRPGAKRIDVLEIIGYDWPESGSRETVTARFQNVLIEP